MSMADLELVLPNLASFRQWGKLAERCSLAKKLGCQLVEVPGDLVKNVTEMARTGQAVGDILGPEGVSSPYGQRAERCRFILHTDPGIPRRAGQGRLFVPELRWSDRHWTGSYAESIGDMAAAIGRRPRVLLENKARQKVARVEEMTVVMDALPRGQGYGLVIDVPNLWRSYRSGWKEAFRELPREYVRGVHLHWKHRAPGADDPIDWAVVLGTIRDRSGPLFVNPEVSQWTS